MKSVHRILALGLAKSLSAMALSAMALGAPTAAFAQATESVTFNVQVQVSHLAPEVASVLLQCEIRIGETTVAYSSYTPQALSSGAFNGAVPVVVKFLQGKTIQQVVAAKGRYQCVMYLQDAANVLWVPVASPADAGNRPPPASWSWAYPQPGAPFTVLLAGSFPPTR